MPAVIPGGSRNSQQLAQSQEKSPPAHSPSPYDVGGRFPLLGQELGVMDDLLQEADHPELQLLVGLEVLPRPTQPWNYYAGSDIDPSKAAPNTQLGQGLPFPRKIPAQEGTRLTQFHCIDITRPGRAA